MSSHLQVKCLTPKKTESLNSTNSEHCVQIYNNWPSHPDFFWQTKMFAKLRLKDGSPWVENIHNVPHQNRDHSLYILKPQPLIQQRVTSIIILLLLLSVCLTNCSLSLPLSQAVNKCCCQTQPPDARTYMRARTHSFSDTLSSRYLQLKDEMKHQKDWAQKQKNSIGGGHTQALWADCCISQSGRDTLSHLWQACRRRQTVSHWRAGRVRHSS